MANPHQHYILTLCQQLHAKGKTPTVGLIRAKADRTLTIPAIVSALKHWQQAPEQTTSNLSEQPEPEVKTLEERVDSLEKDVAQLKQALQSLLEQKA